MRDEDELTQPLRVLGPGGQLAPAAPAVNAATGRSWFATLTGRAILTTTLAALAAVAITAVVAFPLAVRAANNEGRESLQGKRDLAVDLIGSRFGALVGDGEVIIRRLRKQGNEVYVIRRGLVTPTGLPDRIVAEIQAADGPVSDRALINGRVMLVEGQGFGNGNGIVLTQRAVTGTARQVWGRLWLALVLGLAGGAVAGMLLARRLAKPFRNAATAARRLRAGDRAVRLPIDAPAEAEDLSRALNELAEALATSEGRQRDFLLSVSHELRTPLTSIRGYAEALADGVVGPDGAVQVGQTMLAEAERLDRLVADLLALARLEAADFPLEFAEVDLNTLVLGAHDAWKGRVEANGLQLRMEMPNRPVLTWSDPGRLRQVLDALLENALRVVPPGSPVVLALRENAVAGRVGEQSRRPVRFAELEVRDGGPGFTDEDLAVAFERGALYQRYRGVRKVGSGLGLALAARLVRRLGGQIEAGHAVEGGARFTVRLPVTALPTPNTALIHR
jgi:two-component system sensor histidine kinase BaeS